MKLHSGIAQWNYCNCQQIQELIPKLTNIAAHDCPRLVPEIGVGDSCPRSPGAAKSGEEQLVETTPCKACTATPRAQSLEVPLLVLAICCHERQEEPTKSASPKPPQKQHRKGSTTKATPQTHQLVVLPTSACHTQEDQGQNPYIFSTPP